MPLSKRKFRNKVILTDCDGVLLNWIDAFHEHMEMEGYRRGESNSYHMASVYPDLDKPETRAIIERFNQSANMAFLEPIRDSVHYVKKLHEQHGYRFLVVTSMTSNQYAIELRRQNLERLFGDRFLYDLISLECGAPKRDTLRFLYSEHPNAVWIEDKVENALEGDAVGFDSILIRHPYNQHYDEQGPLTAVDNWKEIYDYIV